VDPRIRSLSAIARHLGISQPAVSAWARGTARPEGPHREALQVLTGGAVASEAWMRASERRDQERLQRVGPLGSSE
jgi:predicted transcriptional regulator